MDGSITGGNDSIRIQPLIEVLLAAGAGQLLLERAFVQEDEGGDGADVELGSQFGFRAGVDLYNFQFLAALIGNLVEKRDHGPAGRTGGGIKINKDRSGMVLHFLAVGVLGDGGDHGIA